MTAGQHTARRSGVKAPAAALAALAAIAAIYFAFAASQEERAPEATSAIVSGSTPHLSFTAALSHDSVAAGEPLVITADLRPAKGMYVYAPGSTYEAVTIELDAGTVIQTRAPVYSKPTTYFFEPLQEQVLVYKEPFRLVLGVALTTAAARDALRTGSNVVVRGQLEYQACDDRVCYLPASIPLEWRVRATR